MKFRTRSAVFNILTPFALVLTLLSGALTATPAYAASITVTSTADTVANDGVCTLREAITSANSDAVSGAAVGECSAGSGADSISFAANYTITAGSQFPVVTTPITINGNGAANTIIQGAAASQTGTHRIFEISGTGNLTLNDVTVANGGCGGSCSTNGTNGGGIYNAGALTITNSTISGHRANSGAGVENSGTLSVSNSNFTDNHANNGDGGGIDNRGGTVNVVGSTFSSNFASFGGSGIKNITGGTLTITNSTFTGNTATDDTIGNSTTGTANTLTIINSTIAGNSGSYGILNGSSTTLNIKNTIVAGNSGGLDCYNSGGTIGADVKNLIQANASGVNACGTPAFTSNPNLGTLANNGGSTRTLVLLDGSPAIDAGDDATCAAVVGSPTFGAGGKDQRSVTRPQGTHCDIGAYEKTDNPTFADVPYSFWSWQYIERLYNDGITGGCSASPLMYCPATTVTRDQMAVFLLRGEHSSAYNPPAATGTMFADVPSTHWAAAWIEQLANEGITGGCGNGNYCPSLPVTRDQMAVFLLRGEHGGSYTPPTATGTMFADVPSTHWAAAWIEQLANEGITGGCGNGNYCPNVTVTRDQMAVFLVRAFNLP